MAMQARKERLGGVAVLAEAMAALDLELDQVHGGLGVLDRVVPALAGLDEPLQKVFGKPPQRRLERPAPRVIVNERGVDHALVMELPVGTLRPPSVPRALA